MDFETFKEELANSVKERLDSRGGEEYSVTLNKVDKANETYDAVTVVSVIVWSRLLMNKGI